MAHYVHCVAKAPRDPGLEEDGLAIHLAILGKRTVRFCLPILALLVSLFLGSANAQTSRFEGRIVKEVHYDPEKQPLSTEDLQTAQAVRVGEPLRASEVAATIDRLFATGRYEDIQVHAESQDNGVVIRFATRSARFIGHVGTQGKMAIPPTAGQIVNAADLALGTPF